MRLKQKVSTFTIAILLSTTFTNFANADSLSNYNLDNEYNNREVIQENSIEDDEDILFELAQKNIDGKTIDENGNEVYRIIQIEEISLTRSGDTLKTYSETSFKKIEDSVNTRTSITETGWDKTSSAYIKSTTNYTISGNYIKLNSCSGSVSNLNSGVTVYNLTVTIGCSSPIIPQRVTKDYGKSTSFSYTPPSTWKQVPNVIGGAVGSNVGSSMSIKLGRSSSSTWTQTFTNNIGYSYNG